MGNLHNPRAAGSVAGGTETAEAAGSTGMYFPPPPKVAVKAGK